MHCTSLPNLIKKVLLFFLIFCFVINAPCVYAAPLYQNLDYAPPKCEGIKEDTFNDNLTRVVNDFFTNEAATTDVQSIVERKWLVLGIDSVINSEVDKAVKLVKNNTGYWGRFTSNWDCGKAEKLTKEVAELAFSNSTYFKTSLQKLSEEVAEELSRKLETTFVKSSSYAMDCLQQFINEEYSQTAVNVFSTYLKNSTQDFDSYDLNYQPETLSFIKSHKYGFSGASYFLIKNVVAKKFFTEIENRIVRQVLERILGKFAGGLIPLVDVIILLQTVGDFANPDATMHQIQKFLKEPEIKHNFRTEIVNSVEKQLSVQSPKIASLISSAVYEQWKDFIDKAGRTLNLAKELPELNKIIETNDLVKVSKLVGVLEDNSGLNVLQESIKDGSFEKLLALPERSYRMLNRRDSSPSLLLQWGDLAGIQLDDVVTLELYKHFSPNELDRQLLADILALKDRSTISKLSLLEVDAIRNLFLISKENLISVATHLSSQDLTQLAEYLGKLNSQQFNRLLELINENPSVIKNPNVIEHILQSQNFNAALEAWKTVPSIFSFIGDVSSIFTNSISWKLLLDKYGFPAFFLIVGVPIILILAIAMWFYRQWLEIRQKQQSLGE